MPNSTYPMAAADCPSRVILDQIADKWSVLVLAALCNEPLRFNALRRQLEGITQKALSHTLRRLERNGIVERRVIASAPVAVEYRITPLGRTLEAPFQALHQWTLQYHHEVEKARSIYDARQQALEDETEGC
ncbi:transcriptional regulator [Billgrantia tianxiuensis]|uniref:Transcriptional regulator n=1 Tax=Billgrantia tianxiuensis TaxID=2497861 RepID=A0A6I6SNK9_9GAMM|nr:MULTISPECIES: helix-turn-helix domain-containing protein [Halomonas]MCE8033823.1 helix-turn-helix transcriptional regulator [Halomonas sp. MCCC 1A11057]QHC51382.1 transcriptional regulator [Halomonas tianxiuensis]